MKKSTVWQSIVSAIIILVVLITLDIPHPDWITGLLFWQTQWQREIAWHLGIDLGETYRITLVPDSSKNQKRPDTAQMQETLAIIDHRARNLSTAEPVVQLQGNFIVAQVPYLENLATMTQTLQAPGLIEFIASSQELAPNEVVKTTTTLGASETTPSQEITTTQDLETVYSTLVNNNGLEHTKLQPPRRGYYSIASSFKPEAQSFLSLYNSANPSGYICVTLDKRVLSCFLSSDLSWTDSGAVQVPILIDVEQAPSISALVQSGILPVQLRVEKIERAGPTLGEQTVRQIGIASIIALAAALVFLLVHYRLPGLLTDLAFLVFGLLSLALCKILPLPITLANVIGLAAVSLSTLGGLLSIAERLRKQIRAGQPLPKAIEFSFSNAWPSIRNTHLVLLLFAVIAWVVGTLVVAQTIRWLGISLVAGTLASLFATMVFSRSLMSLIFGIDAVQAWVNERKWLLDI
ncbi:MAG: hypothetical protein AB8I69_17020 [Anaerolineae bacterium]